jgi:hypothetical protein
MVRYFALAALSVALVSLGAPAGGADKPEVGTKLDGAWKLVGARSGDGGEYAPLPDGLEQYKLVVGGRFIWTTSKDGKVQLAGGGRYTVAGDTYTEFIEYTHGEGVEGLAGKEAKFTWKLDGGRWYHKGTIKTDQGDIPIDELWERAKK